MTSLVYGVWGTTGGMARSVTLSFTRYDWSGPILENLGLGALLDQALAGGFGWCFVQRRGHVLSEDWDLPHWGAARVVEEVERLAGDPTLFLAGIRAGAEGAFAEGCFLVNLALYRRVQGSVCSVDDLVAGAAREGLGVATLPAGVLGRSVDLAEGDALARYAGTEVARIPAELPPEEGLSPRQLSFLRGVGRQVRSARDGVFLWNIEGYDDVPERVAPNDRVTSVYCVAAGFKPYFFLARGGYDANSRMVFFDYSPVALAVKRFLVEHWDGHDFVSFLPKIFEAFPAPPAFYQLWRDAQPGTVDRRDLEAAWAAEVARWGGAEAFAAHWVHLRRLEHVFLHCDLLQDPSPLIREVRDEPGGRMWWSNAFFTIGSNWCVDLSLRRERYLSFVRSLRERSPRLEVYGSDHMNSNVNQTSVEAYFKALSDRTDLDSHRVGKVALRM